MSQYCYVQSNTVVAGPQALPKAWTDPNTGILYANFDSLSDPELLTLGWYPYQENDPGSPGAYYRRVYGDFVILATVVTRDVTYEQWDIEEVRSSKNGQLIRQVAAYTVSELAINPKVKEYVENDAKWTADKQAELARLTDWQAVADFDITKPLVLVLPNAFVGDSYVRQGVALTARNQAAVDSGQPAPYDQAQINTFIASNQNAADDPSNSTPPVKPGFEIRQEIANPSEQFNRVIIWRFDVDDPNPFLRRKYAMQISNRQDTRDLYIFSYTNGTYLTWRKFELQPDGVTWYLEATPAEQQYVDTDMKFIFSYGTNPAVEADYFTDEVPFPAGVEERNFLVAWDPE